MAPVAAAGSAAIGPVVIQVDPNAPDCEDRLLDGLGLNDPALVLLFATDEDRLHDLARTLGRRLSPDCLIAGCSSAGEIGPCGYATGSILAIGFPRCEFRARALELPNLSGLPVSDWMSALRAMHRSFAPEPDRALFGLVLVDGLAGQEDALVATIDAALPSVMTLGGSAGDGLDFQQTTLVLGDQVLTNAGLFLLVETSLSIHEVTFAHFSPTMTRAVVTAAQPDRRCILELNAEPAAEEYARIIGTSPDALTPTDFARHPLLLRMGDRHHVRAISSTTGDGGLSLMSSIETGTVLTLGRAEDLTRGFADALDALPQVPLMVLGFDCILRRLALERAGLDGRMGDLFTRYRVAGFNTYGEQHSGMHVNQTFVGLAFMASPEGETGDSHAA